jgi:hypothetical protein
VFKPASRGGPPRGGPSGEAAYAARRSGAGSHPVLAISRSAILARSAFFAFSHAGATAPSRVSVRASTMPVFVSLPKKLATLGVNQRRHVVFTTRRTRGCAGMRAVTRRATAYTDTLGAGRPLAARARPMLRRLENAKVNGTDQDGRIMIVMVVMMVDMVDDSDDIVAVNIIAMTS